VSGRLLAGLLLLLAHAAGSPGGPDPPDRFPRAGAAYLVAVDGRAIWARAPDEPRPPASLTKLMAALVLLDRGWAPEAWVRVSARAARETGSRLGLRAGEEVAAGDALLATLVASANDACLALAEGAAGSAEAFVARMNRRAEAMGLGATRFENPCGHDAPGQRSSARDLWHVARVALASPELRRMVAADRGRATTRGGRTIEFTTGNALLGRLEGARGVKSGFTPGAGKCLVALAERGGVEVVLVLLGAPDRWWTAAGIVEAAFREAERGG
jgi:D-alanyl-D-alanine carboxypeptidase (penicillin-binding protein 5/6)